MSVSRQNDIIRFTEAYRPVQLGYFFKHMDLFLLGKPSQIVLDFTHCTDAFPNTIVPTIAMVSRFREMGYNILATLPQEARLRKRFQDFNWAHYLSPTQFALSDDVSEPHLVCKQFRTAQEHYRISNGIVDIITKTIGASRSALGMLDWVINELMDNVINHSESPAGGFAQLAIFPPSSKLAFCVADCGLGILHTLRPKYPQLTSDRIAIQEAVKAGVTRDKNVGQGNGLSGSLTLAVHTRGRFSSLSGKAEVLWTSDEPVVSELDAAFYGTMIDIQLPYNEEIDFSRLLTTASRSPYYIPIDIRGADWIDTRYTSDDGSYLKLEMAEEIENVGFGSRSNGAHMKTKAMYLLSASPAIPLVISWTGVGVIASSYADEFIGKLFVELGPIAFMARIRLMNMDGVVQNIINRAIMQRTVQTMNG